MIGVEPMVERLGRRGVVVDRAPQAGQPEQRIGGRREAAFRVEGQGHILDRDLQRPVGRIDVRRQVVVDPFDVVVVAVELDRADRHQAGVAGKPGRQHAVADDLLGCGPGRLCPADRQFPDPRRRDVPHVGNERDVMHRPARQSHERA